MVRECHVTMSMGQFRVSSASVWDLFGQFELVSIWYFCFVLICHKVINLQLGMSLTISWSCFRTFTTSLSREKSTWDWVPKRHRHPFSYRSASIEPSMKPWIIERNASNRAWWASMISSWVLQTVESAVRRGGKGGWSLRFKANWKRWKRRW